MVAILSAAGRAFLRAFVGSLLVLLPGVLAAPNLNNAFGLGVAALIASVVAGFKVVEEFVPRLAVGGPYGKIITAALQAGVASFLVLAPGVLNAPDMSTAKAALTALLVGVATAVVRSLQGFFTLGDTPAVERGVDPSNYPG